MGLWPECVHSIILFMIHIPMFCRRDPVILSLHASIQPPLDGDAVHHNPWTRQKPGPDSRDLKKLGWPCVSLRVALCSSTPLPDLIHAPSFPARTLTPTWVHTVCTTPGQKSWPRQYSMLGTTPHKRQTSQCATDSSLMASSLRCYLAQACTECQPLTATRLPSST